MAHGRLQDRGYFHCIQVQTKYDEAMKNRVREALATEGKSFCSLIETSGAYHDAKFVEDRHPDFFALYDLLCPQRFRLFFGSPGESIGGFTAAPVRAPAWAKEVFWANDFYVAQNHKAGADFVKIIRGLTDWLKANCKEPFLYGIEHSPYSLQRLVRLLSSVGFQMEFIGWSRGCALSLRPATANKASTSLKVTELTSTANRAAVLSRLNLDDHPLARIWTDSDLANLNLGAGAVRFVETTGASALIADLTRVKRFRDRQRHELKSLSLGSLRADSPAQWQDFLSAAAAMGADENYDMIFYRDPPFESEAHKPAVFLRRAFAIYFSGRVSRQDILEQTKGFRSDAFAI